MTAVRTFDAACTLGLETVLEGELRALGAQGLRPRRGGVVFEGDLALGYRACLWLRSAVRVLERLAVFDVDVEQDLYDRVAALPWEDWMGPDDTLAVEATVRESVPSSPRFAAVRVKDAVCDRFRDRDGRRPSVDREAPRVPLHLRLVKGRATLARDLAGDSLHRRGYRPIQVKSPLNEATAAGLLLLAGYDGTGALLDPMCGSGTFLIEAAWIATDRAPGLDRTFAFRHWPDFDAPAWGAIVDEAMGRMKPADPDAVAARFVGLEIHGGALTIARKCIEAAEVERVVTVGRADAGRWSPDGPIDWVFTNPPWGERLVGDVEESWAALAELLRACPGAKAHVLSGNPELSGRLRLKADRKWPVRTGPIDARLLRYAIRERTAG